MDMESFPELIFNIAGAPLLLFWFLIVFLPKWSWTDKIYRTQLPLFYLAALYGIVVIYGLIQDPAPFATLMDPTLASVKVLLGTDTGASAAWIHFLCFDLLVGTLIWRKALKKNHAFWWVSPNLVLTLFLAPLGWLVFEITSRILCRCRSDGPKT